MPHWVKIGRKWHVAVNWGYRTTIFESRSCCGREKRGGGYIYTQPYPEPQCRTCVRIATRYGWL